ncbi:MAG: extracellular solute-binding protein [Armatimonadetes bacterium]|nr:extracellular solute-binding protein [Armatimonadota bacterium]
MRRLLLIVLALGALAGCARKEAPTDTPPISESKAPGGGVTLRILALNWPQAAVEQKLADAEFTPKTGIKVVLETNRYDDVEIKMKQTITSRSSDYDIVHYDSQWLGQFVAANGLERLDTSEFLNSPDATIKFDDFIPEYAYVLGRYPTKERDIFAGKFDLYKDTPVYGLPWASGCQILFYRKDLLKEAGFVDSKGEAKPPQTWEEFVSMAKKLTVPGKRYGAWTHAGRQGDYITQDFFPIMWANGGELWDPDKRQAQGIVNSPQNVKALEFYCSWMKEKIVPSESANWGNEEVFNAIAQDKVVMGQLWATFGAGLEDPKSSKVVGKMDYTVVPGFKDPRTGQIRRAAMYGSQGTAITSFSTHKKEAWQYIEWLMSKDTQQKILADPTSAFVSSRKDLIDETKATNPRNKATLESTPFVHDFWNNPEYSELLNVMQTELNQAFTGQKTPKKALDDAAAALQKILNAQQEAGKS